MIDWDSFYREEQARIELKLKLNCKVEFTYSCRDSTWKLRTFSGKGIFKGYQNKLNLTVRVTYIYPTEDVEIYKMYPFNSRIYVATSFLKTCDSNNHIDRIIYDE